MKFKSSSCFRNTLAVSEILNKKLNHNILPLSNTVLNSVLESGKHVRETYTLSEAVLMPNHNQCFEQTQEKCQIVSTFFFFFFFFFFFIFFGLGKYVFTAPLWKSGAILDSPCPSVVP